MIRIATNGRTIAILVIIVLSSWRDCAALAKGPPIILSRSSHALALESASRELTPAELEVVGDDLLARYTFFRMQVDLAMRGEDTQTLPRSSNNRITSVPLTMATERLLKLVSSDSPGEKEFASFLRSSWRQARFAVYIARRGRLSVEEHSVFEEFEFNIALNSVGKYYGLLKHEPPTAENKLDFFLGKFSWSGSSGAIVLRVSELSGSVVDELADRMVACATGPLEDTDDLNTVVLGFYVLGALGDPRLRDFPLDHFLESPRIADRPQDSRERWRKAFERFRGRAPGKIELKRTKAFQFLEWSRSLPSKVSFVQVD